VAYKVPTKIRSK